MPSHKILTATLWQIASQIVMAIMAIVSTKVVSLALSKEMVGYYNSSYGYLQIFAILADFGLYATAVKELSRAKEEQREHVLSALFFLRIMTITLSFSLALSIAWILPSWKGTPLPYSVLLAAFVPVATLLAGVFRTVFQVYYRMHFVFIAETLQRVITAVLMVAILFLFHLDRSPSTPFLFLFIGIGAVGSVILMTVSIIISHHILPFRVRCYKEAFRLLLRRSFPFGIAFLCTALYRYTDLTLLSLLRPDFALLNAEYGFALRMADLFYLLPTFLLNAVLPKSSEAHEKGEATDRLMGRTFIMILFLSGIPALCSFFLSRPLLSLLTSEAYLSSATVIGSDTALKFLSPGIFCNGLVLYSFYTLLTTHKTTALVWSMMIGVLCSITLNIVLIPAHGFLGAATTSSLTQCILAIILLPQAFYTLPISLSRTLIILAISVTLIVALIFYGAAPFLSSDIRTVFFFGTIVLLCLGVSLVFLRRQRKSTLVPVLEEYL